MKIALAVCGNLEKGVATYLSASSTRTKMERHFRLPMMTQAIVKLNLNK